MAGVQTRQMDPLDLRREREREKYLKLMGKRCLPLLGMRYGATNHGRSAIKLVASWKPRFVADFGCGNNAFLRGLRRCGVEGVGIDFANDNADILAPMHQVPIEDGRADVVTCFDALEHLLPEDVQQTLEEMRRVGSPGEVREQSKASGRFVFTICTRPSFIKVNGENLHPTVRPRDWWLAQIARVGRVTQLRGRQIRGVWRR